MGGASTRCAHSAEYLPDFGVFASKEAGSGYVKETHEAMIVLALADRAVGRLDGGAVGGPPGTVVGAGPHSVAEAFGILAQGRV